MITPIIIHLCDVGWKLFDRFTSMAENPEIDAPAESDEAWRDYVDHCEKCEECTVKPK